MFSKTIISIFTGLALTAGAQAADKKGADVYKSAYAACHATGSAGAPKFGDKTA